MPLFGGRLCRVTRFVTSSLTLVLRRSRWECPRGGVERGRGQVFGGSKFFFSHFSGAAKTLKPERGPLGFIGRLISPAIFASPSPAGWRCLSLECTCGFFSPLDGLVPRVTGSGQRGEESVLSAGTLDSGRSPVYAKDHLCPVLKKLLGQVIARKNEKQWKYAWSREGKVFARKTDTTRVLRVTCTQDLDKTSEKIIARSPRPVDPELGGSALLALRSAAGRKRF
ncbi:hypothetical protein HPB47_006895, partial [Ixodes persulcatus]